MSVLEFAVTKMRMRDELYNDLDGIADVKTKNWGMFEIEVDEIKQYYEIAKNDKSRIVVEYCKKCELFLKDYNEFLLWTQKFVEWVGAPIEPDFYTGIESIMTALCMVD